MPSRAIADTLVRETRIPGPDGRHESGHPAIAMVPRESSALLVFAHGAGAGMRHPFMDGVAVALAERNVATLRFEFPYMAEGRRRPDAPKRLTAAVRAVARFAGEEYPDLPLFAGGKSLGGRMSSTSAVDGGIDVRGLVFFGFPLHAPGRDGTERSKHLESVRVPILFLQGSRDKLARIDLIRRVHDRLNNAGAPPRGVARSSLHVLEDADHSFRVPKRTGMTDSDVFAWLAEHAAAWMREIV